MFRNSQRAFSVLSILNSELHILIYASNVVKFHIPFCFKASSVVLLVLERCKISMYNLYLPQLIGSNDVTRTERSKYQEHAKAVVAFLNYFSETMPITTTMSQVCLSAYSMIDLHQLNQIDPCS